MVQFIQHIVAIPFPVLSLMELSLWLFKEVGYKRVIKALSENDGVQGKISLVSILDGLGPDEDRTDLKKLTE